MLGSLVGDLPRMLAVVAHEHRSGLIAAEHASASNQAGATAVRAARHRVAAIVAVDHGGF